MRIAFVTHQFFPMFSTGVERLTLNVASQLRRMGHSCVVITAAEHSSGEDAPYNFEGVRVRPVRVAGASLFPGSDHNVDAALGAVLDQEGVEVVDVMQPLRLSGAFAEADKRGLPVVAHIADFTYVCARITLERANATLCPSSEDGEACVSVCGIPTGPARIAYARTLLARAAAVVCPCRATIDRYAAEGFDVSRWTYVPWGVDFALHPRRLPPPGGERLVLGFIGTLLPHKGPALIAEAMAQLPDAPIEAHIHGEAFHARDYERGLQRAAAADPRLRLMGPYTHDEFQDVLAPLDAVVVPSMWQENSPTAALNAIASGVPLIAADADGIAEVVQDHACGFTFPRADAHGLAKLLADPLGLKRELADIRKSLRLPAPLEYEALCLESLYAAALRAGEPVAGSVL